MSTSEYSLTLPAFTIGVHAYDAIGKVTQHFGKKVVIIGGKKALAHAKQPLLDAIAKTDLQVLDVLWYGDDATYEHVDRLLHEKAVQDAQLIFGVGGGRAIDTCKVVADKAGKAFFSFPTLASNCAPSTAVAVMYKADKSFAGYYYLDQPPVHTFINTDIIVHSPYQYFWAGIGDAMSKECETELASRAVDQFHTIVIGRALGKGCTEPLLQYGEKALADFQADEITFEFQQVVLDIIISTGLVSNCMTGGEEYYYNSSLAHLFYNASTVLPQVVEGHLHGEIVSFGVLILLTYDQQLEMRDRVAQFYKKAHYPLTLADLDIKEEEVDAIVEKAPSITEWGCVPEPLTKAAFKKAILDTNMFGKTL